MLMLDKIEIEGRSLMVVRDDIYPFIGGGSKARKAVEYEKYLRAEGYNAVVTCGGVQSNHNRAIALMAARNGWKCHIVFHGTRDRFMAEKGNALLVRMSGASYEFVEASGISDAMDAAMDNFARQGLKPYYVTGGGHDLPGGIAFVKAVEELEQQCKDLQYKPDYIFHASGTGSTQAGLAVGLDRIGWDDVKLIGISVARQYERGHQVIVDFANKLSAFYGMNQDYSTTINFDTDYLYDGYEKFPPEMGDYLENVTRRTGLVFDTTYSGKAFYGMMRTLSSQDIKGDVLFWHTGGIMNIMR